MELNFSETSRRIIQKQFPGVEDRRELIEKMKPQIFHIAYPLGKWSKKQRNLLDKAISSNRWLWIFGVGICLYGNILLIYDFFFQPLLYKFLDDITHIAIGSFMMYGSRKIKEHILCYKELTEEIDQPIETGQISENPTVE